MLMARRTPLTFTLARSGRSRSSVTSPGIPRHIDSPLSIFPFLVASGRPQDLARPVGDDADDALGEAHAAGLLQPLAEERPAQREALAEERLELRRLGDGVEGGDGPLAPLAPAPRPKVIADCEADERLHPGVPPLMVLAWSPCPMTTPYMDFSSR